MASETPGRGRKKQRKRDETRPQSSPIRHAQSPNLSFSNKTPLGRPRDTRPPTPGIGLVDPEFLSWSKKSMEEKIDWARDASLSMQEKLALEHDATRKELRLQEGRISDLAEKVAETDRRGVVVQDAVDAFGNLLKSQADMIENQGLKLNSQGGHIDVHEFQIAAQEKEIARLRDGKQELQQEIRELRNRLAYVGNVLNPGGRQVSSPSPRGARHTTHMNENRLPTLNPETPMGWRQGGPADVNSSPGAMSEDIDMSEVIYTRFDNDEPEIGRSMSLTPNLPAQNRPPVAPHPSIELPSGPRGDGDQHSRPSGNKKRKRKSENYASWESRLAELVNSATPPNAPMGSTLPTVEAERWAKLGDATRRRHLHAMLIESNEYGTLAAVPCSTCKRNNTQCRTYKSGLDTGGFFIGYTCSRCRVAKSVGRCNVVQAPTRPFQRSGAPVSDENHGVQRRGQTAGL